MITLSIVVALVVLETAYHKGAFRICVAGRWI